MKKKSIFLIILIALMILGFAPKAFAADLEFQYTSGGFPFYRGNEGIFCAQAGGPLRSSWGILYYNKVGSVTLTPQLAYAFANTNDLHVKQQIVWQTALNSGAMDDEHRARPGYYEAKALLEKAQRYKKPLTTKVTVNETNAKVVSKDDNNYKIGPFNLNFEKGEFSGLGDLYLTDNNGKRINVTSVILENGYKGNINNINPNENFYVTCNVADTVGAAKVSLKARYDFTIYEGIYNKYACYAASNTSVWKAKQAQRMVGIIVNNNRGSDTGSSPEVELTIDLAGTVFEDILNGKSNSVNGYLDNDDIRKKDISVTLYKKDGTKVVQDGLTNPVKTNEQGKYEFKKVSAADEYYVEFKYDGQNYEPTTYQLNGRKTEERSYATDGPTARKNFNKVYEQISSDVARNREMIAYTGPYGLENQVKYYSVKNSEVELKNINFGMMKREEVDLRLTKDLYEAKITINGKQQVYRYNGRDYEDMTLNIDARNMIVVNVNNAKTVTAYPNNTRGTEYEAKNGVYERAIRKADLDYKLNDADQTGAIELYATYVMRLYNQSTSLIDMEATKLIDWYDKSYTYMSSTINKKTDITWNQVASDHEYFNKMELTRDSGVRLQVGESEYVYVTYKVDVNSLKNRPEGTEELKQNYAEIGAYKTYYHSERKDLNNARVLHSAGEVAGLIDKDSVPANFNIKNRNYEDDADKSPGLKLIVAGQRTVAGNVWEEEPIAERLKKENVRIGDGQKSEDEKSIQGVIVQLVEINSDGTDKTGGQVYNTTTDANGNYQFVGYIPGNYVVRFRYGEGETLTTSINDGRVYTGQDYKSTIYDADKHKETEYWYTDNSNSLSDAVDNMQRRKEVNEYSKALTNHIAEVLNYKAEKYDQNDATLMELENNTKMKAQTAKMNLEVEYARTTTELKDMRNTQYDVNKVDFGIIERPRSELTLNKKVSNLKVITADGQTLFDANGPTTNLAWNSKVKMIQATIDENLLHGANLQLTYEMEVVNTGEKDYNDDNFYITGRIPDESKLVKTKTVQLVDYIANNIDFNKDVNTNWSIATTNELQQAKAKPEDKSLTNLVDSNVDISKYNVILKLGDNNQLNSKALTPGENLKDSVFVSKVLASENDQDSLTYDNMIELIITTNEVGRRSYQDKVSVPGNLNPETQQGLEEPDAAKAEEVIVLPPYGMDTKTIIMYSLGAIGLAIVFAGGIILIKKRVLKK